MIGKEYVESNLFFRYGAVGYILIDFNPDYFDGELYIGYHTIFSEN